MTTLNYGASLTPRIRRMILDQVKVEIDTVTEVQTYASGSTLRPRKSVNIQTVNRIMRGANPDSIADLDLVKIAEALRVVRVNDGAVSMAAPLSANLISASIKSRLLTAGRAWFCGDSICSNLVAGKRFHQGAFKTWNANWAGIYIARQLQSSGSVDGIKSLHTDPTNSTNSKPDANDWDLQSGDDPGTSGVPEPLGKFDWTAAFIPNGRLERIQATAQGDANAQVSNYTGITNAVKSGGAYPWLNPGWLTSNNLKVAGVVLQHTLGCAGSYRGKSDATVGARVAYDTSGTLGIVKTPAADVGTVIAGWTDLGAYIEITLCDVGDGLVEFYTHLYDDATKDTGVHLGSIAMAGVTSAEWLGSTGAFHRYNATRMAEFIEVNKADTFIIALGMNDSNPAGSQASKATYKTRIEAIITALETAHAIAQGNDATIRDIKFCLLGMYEGKTDRREILADYADALHEIAAANPSKIGFINLYRASGTNESLVTDGYLDNDDVHPTLTGAPYFMGLVNTELEAA